MKTFIRVAEIWVPAEDGTLLELSGGIFDEAPRYGEISRKLCFGRAEGLPGHAWDQGQPLMLSQLEGSYFQRTPAARAAGLSCAVALPIFLADRLTSVVVLLCGESEAHVGAIELWRNDPRISTDLTLADGYFGSMLPDFEDYSRDGSLSRGAGAPGLAWQREAAVFIDDIAESSHFLRSQLAAKAGIVHAMAMPCSTRQRSNWVLTLLSSVDRPMARRVESWQAEGGGSQLHRSFGHCQRQGRLSSDPNQGIAAEALGPIGRAWCTGVAQAMSRTGAAADDDESTHEDGLPFHSVLAIPVITGDAVSEVVALHF